MGEGPPTISTHVLDTARGEPAVGVRVRLFRIIDGVQNVVAGEGTTDSDGRIRRLLADDLQAGDYRLLFDLDGPDVFFTSFGIGIRILDTSRSHHVPLLLGPYSMTTYRGS